MTRRPALPALAAGLAVTLGLAFFLRSQHTVVPNPTPAMRQSNDAAFDPIKAGEIQDILPQDAIPAIDAPHYVEASRVSDIGNDEQVIGLLLNGEARAFPTSTLSVHEIVNDTIARPVSTLLRR